LKDQLADVFKIIDVDTIVQNKNMEDVEIVLNNTKDDKILKLDMNNNLKNDNYSDESKNNSYNKEMKYGKYSPW